MDTNTALTALPIVQSPDSIPDAQLRVRFDDMVTMHRRTIDVLASRVKIVQRMLGHATKDNPLRGFNALIAPIIRDSRLKFAASDPTSLNYLYAPQFAGSFSAAKDGAYYKGPLVTVFGEAHLKSDATYRESVALHEALHLFRNAIAIDRFELIEDEQTAGHDRYFLRLERALHKELLGLDVEYGNGVVKQPWYVDTIKRDGNVLWNADQFKQVLERAGLLLLDAETTARSIQSLHNSIPSVLGWSAGPDLDLDEAIANIQGR